VSATIIVVGLGNIGSALVAYVGRMAGVGRVILVDSDAYEAKNLASQIVRRHEVGEPKAVVQGRRLREINPALSVTVVVDRVENVPLGLLRGTVLLACLDSRAARRTVNAAAWRNGIPWIDAGVNGEELLARVNVY
jgi:sulfur carrier protein ThiS adenylyltransferase